MAVQLSTHPHKQGQRSLKTVVAGALSGRWVPVRLLLIVGDMLALATAVVASTAATEVIQTQIFLRGRGEFYTYVLYDRLMIIGAISALVIGWFAYQRHYTGRRGCWTEAKHVLLAALVAALADGWLHFALKMDASRLWQVQLWLYAAIFLIFGRYLARRLLCRLGRWAQPTLLIGAGKRLEELRAFVGNESALGYDVRAVVHVEHGLQDACDEVDCLVRQHPDLCYALVACSDMPRGSLLSLIDCLEEKRIRYGIMPELAGIPLVGVGVDQFIGYDFILLQSNGLSLERCHLRTAKRCFDVAAASVLLFSLAPLLLMISALLRCEGGPAIYTSRRLGYGGAVFDAFKFRTMRPNAEAALRECLARDAALRAEWAANFKLKSDPRITRLGGFLRRSSLDELPQLVNVLRGEMSLVGPRPLLLDEVPQYERWLQLYQRAVPGITGMWQVSGRSNLDYGRRIELNNWYIQNWSLWHDLVILIKTVRVVVRRQGAV